MKSALNFFVFLFSTFLSFSVIADENSDDFNQWSVTFFSGSNSIDIDESNFSDTVFSGGFEVGYQFDKQFGLKVGIQEGLDVGFLISLPVVVFGAEVDNYNFDSQYIAATARTKEDLYVLGSIGLARIDERLSTSNTNFSLDKNSTGLFWEAGVGWDFSEHFGIELTYSDTAAELSDVSAVNFKIKFEF